MSDDLKAAAERLLHRYHSDPQYMDGHAEHRPEDDFKLVAETYLAEHPADSNSDDVGPLFTGLGDNQEEFWYSEWSNPKDEAGGESTRLVVKRDMSVALIERDGGGDVIFVPVPRTRCDLRLLCKALGIELKEQPQ